MFVVCVCVRACGHACVHACDHSHRVSGVCVCVCGVFVVCVCACVRACVCARDRFLSPHRMGSYALSSEELSPFLNNGP